MNKNEFIGDLTKRVACLHKIVVSNKDIDADDDSDLHFSYNAETKTTIRLFHHEQIEEFSDLIDFILKYQNFSQVFSSTFIEEEITRTLHKTFDDPDTIPSEIEQFYSKLINNSTNEWFIISEVENIKLHSTTISFNLINCTIKFLKEEDIPFEIKLTKIGNSSIEDYIMKPCIFTTVTAGDNKKAINLAFSNFNQSFNLLKVFSPHSKPSIKETYSSELQKFYSYNATKKQVIQHRSRSNYVFLKVANLNKELYTYLQQNGLKELENDNSITKVIKNCLHWFGAGLNEDLQSSKLLNFVTILESTLKKQGEKTELKQRVADRCALLLGSNFDERKEIEKYISDIYNVRSNVVHIGTIIDDENIVEIAREYARTVLIRLIKVNSEYNGNFEKFINEIDDKKYL